MEKTEETSALDLASAFQVTLDLARQGVIDIRDDAEEHARQMEAIDVVEDFAVNQLGDDECEHVIDWGSVSLSHDGATYIDVNCAKCGLSGCLGSAEALAKDVCW
jgi:hypothetical protein